MTFVQIEESDIVHYGILRRSGRYPWGSGKDQTTRNKHFLDYVGELRKQGVSDVDIAKGLEITTTELRAANSIARTEQRQSQINMAQRLRDKGYSKTAIGQRMGIPESTVRNLLAPGTKDKADVLHATSKMLKNQVDEKKFVDVGRGVETHVGVSRTKLDNALAILKEEGYTVHTVPIPQIGTGLDTKTKVLALPGTTQRDAFLNRFKIESIQEYTDDGGRTFYGLHDPIKINPKRVDVVYGSEGGSKADGVMFVRRGVEDVSLGDSTYAQVRVAVGDNHYLKGMATYKDDLPPGIDIQFNTNKESTGNKLDAMKEVGDLPEGSRHPLLKSTKRQIVADKGMPTERVTSAMNIVNEESDWSTWSNTLSSQMLSKQSPTLAKNQLAMTFERRQRDYDNINELTNPVVKETLLKEFADATDSSAVHLQAASLPRQAQHVILPLSKIKPSEIYAPNYNDGERVVLIRHPHAGTFEIPELVVNNKNPEGKKLLGGNTKAAVGIHHTVAERLSGADFDGDTVLVIPNNQDKIKTSSALEGLKNFDPKAAYPGFAGMKVMTEGHKQAEMGKISNLITDMSLQGASHEEIARAVRHSMVIIDAVKHELDYKHSAIDNNIKQLKQKYQSGGASTLISRAGSDLRIPERKPRPAALGGPINRETGQKEFVKTNRVNRITGEPRKVKTAKLAETTDAHTLSSGTPMERVYAEHSNKLKALANQARLASLNVKPIPYSPSAKKAYDKEVTSLNAKLTIAKRNAPLERKAQIIGSTLARQRLDANPQIDDDSKKKIRFQALEEARARTGAKKHKIVVTEDEWNAIQAGAISTHKLREILNNAEMSVIREHATPKRQHLMTSTMRSRARDMLNLGYTRAQVASQLGVSLSTLDNSID